MIAIASVKSLVIPSPESSRGWRVGIAFSLRVNHISPVLSMSSDFGSLPKHLQYRCGIWGYVKSLWRTLMFFVDSFLLAISPVRTEVLSHSLLVVVPMSVLFSGSRLCSSALPPMCAIRGVVLDLGGGLYHSSGFGSSALVLWVCPCVCGLMVTPRLVSVNAQTLFQLSPAEISSPHAPLS